MFLVKVHTNYFRGKFSVYLTDFHVTEELMTEPNCNLRICFLQTVKQLYY